MKHKPLLYVLILAFITKLVLMTKYSVIWWDEAVYLGMGKFIYSFGSAGLWEPIRPVVWPIVIGMFGWTNKIIFARLLSLTCYLGIIIFSYLIAEKIFNQKTAIISSVLLASTPTFFFFSYKALTNVPATFLVIVATYLLIQKRYVWSFLLLSLSFLTRFPFGIFLIPFLIYVFIQDKNNSAIRCVKYGGVFFILPIIYVITNKIFY